MPHKKGKQVIVGFDCIAFVMFTEDDMNEIWCLEMKTMKWFKSHLNFDRELRGCDFVKTDDNFIHCLDYENIHVRFNLYDLIPRELFEFYSKYYLMLIDGYTRIQFEDISGCHVSHDLKILIARYYNSLL